ncbi:WxL domain-containing protein [Dellaglioa sp. L3N]
MKMTTKLISSIALTTFLIPLGISSANVLAAGGDIASDGQTGTTDTSLKLLEQTSPVDPTDPTKPVKPTDPTNPFVPGTGDLRIDYISPIHFGKIQVSGSDKKYGATFDNVTQYQDDRDADDKLVLDEGNTKDVGQYVQVTNKLAGHWSLSVSNTPFVSKTTQLTGATLNLSTPTAKTTADANDATTQDVTLSGDGKSQPVLSSTNVGVTTDMFGDAANADSDGKNSGVQLVVPGSTAKVIGEQYSSDLTWTLTDAGV